MPKPQKSTSQLSNKVIGGDSGHVPRGSSETFREPTDPQAEFDPMDFNEQTEEYLPAGDTQDQYRTYSDEMDMDFYSFRKSTIRDSQAQGF